MEMRAVANGEQRSAVLQRAGESEKAEKPDDLQKRDPEKTAEGIFGKAVDVTISEEGKQLQQSDGRKDGERVHPDASASAKEDGVKKPDGGEEKNESFPGSGKKTTAEDPGVKGSGGGAPQITKAPAGPYDPPIVATNSKDKNTLEQARAKLSEAYATLQKKYDTIAGSGGGGSSPAKKIKSGMMKAEKMMAQIDAAMKTARQAEKKEKETEKAQGAEQKQIGAQEEKNGNNASQVLSDEILSLRE